MSKQFHELLRYDDVYDHILRTKIIECVHYLPLLDGRQQWSDLWKWTG